MSVVCNPTIGPFTLDACSCDCTIVDFDVTITNVCNGSRLGIVVAVKYNNNIVATVCKIDDVTGDGNDCDCINATFHFENVITEVNNCTDASYDSKWEAEILCCNYITNTCCCPKTTPQTS